MWNWIYYSVFVFLFVVDGVFASQKAIKSAQEHFSKESDTKWLVVVGIIVVVGMIIWLINGAKKNSRKKT